MAADEGTIAVIREALAGSERVDARLVDLTLEGGEVVLSGSVASAEEATVAEMVANEHTEAVRSELTVDPNLREDATDGAVVGDEASGHPGSDEADLASELSVQTGGFQPERPSGDLVTDAQEALGENVPLDPPDEPHLAPTESEQRRR